MHPAIVKNQMQMAHILQKCSVLSEEKYEITGSTIPKNEKPLLTASNVSTASILGNQFDKIDPYKYLFTANPVGAKSILQQPPKHPTSITNKPSLYMPMPSLKDVHQPKFDEYIDLNSHQPKVNAYHT
jgi:hypothetical protein